VLPGKKYDPEYYVFTLWRRKWLLVVPAIVTSVGMLAYSSSLPDRYRSEARVLVMPQQVPENYVRPTINSSLQERLQTMSQQILSRTRLERIIDEFGLYVDERGTRIMEDIVQQMRDRDIHLDIPRAKGKREDPTYFNVSFEATNPRTAMQVADRLASLFIQENVQDRSLVAQQTAAFLAAQLEDAGRKLTEQEQRLQAFRTANAGTLPTQVESNSQMMHATQAQLQGAIDTVNRYRDRQLVLEREIADLQTIAASAPPRPTPAPQTTGPNGEPRPGMTAADQLAAARALLANLELRLKPGHPDVQRGRRAVAELERKAEAEASNPALAALAAPATPLPAAPAMSTNQLEQLSRLRAEYESLGRRIDTATKDQERLDAQLATYRQRLEAVPSRESQLAQLTRDYETLQENYRKLLVKSQDAQVAADLERRQIGQQFRIIDSARLPERPFSPDRMRLNLMGAAAGVALGLALIVLLEYRDSSFRTRDDIVTVLALPVLAVVPRMITAIERKRARRRRIMAYSASVALVLVATAVTLWRLRLLDAWVR